MRSAIINGVSPRRFVAFRAAPWSAKLHQRVGPGVRCPVERRLASRVRRIDIVAQFSQLCGLKVASAAAVFGEDTSDRRRP
jgi:hypothetical protein